MPIPPATIDSFQRLSEALTGVDGLPPDLLQPYAKRISKAFAPDGLERLLAAFDALGETPSEAQVRGRILRHEEHGVVAREITMLWYTAGFRAPGPDEPEESGPETPEQYFQGLLWPTIRAHPLGLSGGYFGYWRYPPEN